MPRSMQQEQDILKMPAPKRTPKGTTRRIGIHTSTAGGVENAAERAWRLGCNTFQIFSSSPRQWKLYVLERRQCEQMQRLRRQYDLQPLVIHANYLINLAGGNAEFRAKSIAAFRGELERGLALGAEYVVVHPGSFRGQTREQGLENAARAIAQAAQGLDLAAGNPTVLIENSAGSEFSLGATFEQVAELVQRLRAWVPAAACIDTCHAHVAGYDLVSESGFLETLQRLESSVGLKNVRVWHCNDAKAARGSRLDRHEHVGRGTIGREPFRRLLRNPALAHAAFIAETPIDAPGDDRRNVEALQRLAPRRQARRL